MATYYAIFTTLGLSRLATAQATSTPLVFTHLAVGDGGGAPITPLASMTALVNERARVTINAVDLDPENVDTVRVEGLLPAATGGFTIREAGLFNGAGELIAIASYPDIYKPTPGDGLSVSEYIRILLNYSNVSTAISILVDDSAIMATREYVDDRTPHILYGDGSDGALHFDGASTVLGLVPSSSTYTLTRDIFAQTMTVDSGVTIKTNGYRIFVADTFTPTAGCHITASGDSGSLGGGSVAAGTLVASGGTGGAGGAGTSTTNSYGGAGGAGGSGNAGGTAAAPSAALGSAHVWTPQTLGFIFGGGTWTGLKGGGGGGGGNTGGIVGGGSGGVLVIAARHLVMTSASVFQAAGGHGTNAASGNDSGGGGGGGGTMILVYEDKSPGITFSAATNCPGGVHGTGHGTGVNGVDGSNGTVFEFNMGAP